MVDPLTITSTGKINRGPTPPETINVIITPHIAGLTVMNTAVQHIYAKYCEFKKNGKIKSDVNCKKGY